MFKTRPYSIRKSRHILKTSYKWYQKKRDLLSTDQLKQFETLLQKLDDAILKSDKNEADQIARQTEEFSHAHFKKGILAYLAEMAIAILIALVVATIVRQTWFEPYEIPTGSMRPTFKEQDHLTVTKTVFGINVPLATKHFYFDPNLVQRTSVVIWSGDGIPHLDSDSTFMGIFPYTKRYIKRCLGKPGDTLYFYGGKIYGFDRNGNDLVELRDNPWMAKLENLPFTNFVGRATYKEDRRYPAIPEAIFHHFNQSIGRLRFFQQEIKGEIFNGHNWVEDHPEAQREPHETIQTYSDFWGMRNFAIVRLLNRDQLEAFTPYRARDMEEGLLYLELRHTPSLNYPVPLVSDRFGVVIQGFTTVIPLQEKHLQALMENMYTCRFVVKNGRASAYHLGNEKIKSSSPSFPNVPDGTYEFYYGKALKVGWGAITHLLPADHPLYNSDPKHIQKLFNVGIEMSTFVQPHSRNQPFFPNRYAYFRDGALCVMGGILMEKDDPLLLSFNKRENEKEETSSAKSLYVAFKDYGPPLTSDGKLDKSFLKIFGLKIPENHYLMLGDNHAMSQDSRYFGPIPQENLQGAPSLIIWPPGERWGIPNQKPYPLITLPRLIVWGIVTLIALLWYAIHRHNIKKPIFKKLS
jgi:signal peptidase I